MSDFCSGVSIVIPTRNRWDTLKQVLPSYLDDSIEFEIILVDDCSDTSPPESLLNFPEVICVRNSERKGAVLSRLIGARQARFSYILFGEDDAYLGRSYVKTLLQFLKSRDSIVSGQIVYMKPSENVNVAIKRYQHFNQVQSLIDSKTMTLKHGCRLSDTIKQTFTHALFMVKTEYLLEVSEEAISYFANGTGYREETALQLEIAKEKKLEIVVTPEVVCAHLSRRDVPLGGQRRSMFFQAFYMLRNNIVFLYKYRGQINLYSLLSVVGITFNLLNKVYGKPLLRKLNAFKGINNNSN